jgi:hypothetical protein
VKDPSGQPTPEFPVEITILLSIGGLAFAMWWTFTAPSASGDPISLWSYILLWAREFLIIAFLAVVMICVAVVWFLRLVRRLFAKFK